MQKKLLFFVPKSPYFRSHRLGLAQAAHETGMKVGLMSTDAHESQWPSWLSTFCLPPFSRGGLSPLEQYTLLQSVSRSLQTFQPDILHNVGLKPIIIGTLAGLRAHTPKILNEFAGLGYTFTTPTTGQWTWHKKGLQTILKGFLRLFSRKKNVSFVFHNHDDLSCLKGLGYFSKNYDHAVVIPGSGIGAKNFPVTPLPTSQPFTLVCAARLLKEKGFYDLIEARKILGPASLNIIVCGDIDPGNPSSLSYTDLETWHQEGWIVWKGFCPNVTDLYLHAQGAILPSYREGLPRSLLEAAFLARPIITTDVPGCRDIVQPGQTGWLVPAGDAEALAQAMRSFLTCPNLQEMGVAGRAWAESKFSEEVVHPQIFKMYNGHP